MFKLIKSYGVVELIPSLDLKKVYIELTTKCNFDCVMCIRHAWKENSGSMTLDGYRKILEDMKKFELLKTVNFSGFGEPFCHEDFPAILGLTAKAGFDIEITTNGSLLTPALAEQLIDRGVTTLNVSIDSPESDNFREIRHAELEPIVENIIRLNYLKKQKRSRFPKINIAAVLMRSNVDKIRNLAGLIGPAGIDSIIITNILPYTEEMIVEVLYERVMGPDSDTVDKTKLPGARTLWPETSLKTERRCPFWTANACVISWNGDVAPCVNYLKDYTCYIFGRKKEIRKKSFGNVFVSGLDEIWQSEEYVRFRAKLADFQFPSCTDCYFNDGCNFTKSNDIDCWANSPTCSDCLYSRRILRCP